MSTYLLSGAMLTALVAIAPAAAQLAQAPTVQRAPAMQAHTRTQVGSHVQTMFQRLDANRDGFVTRDEAQAAKGEHGYRHARQLQRQGDRSPEQRAARQAKRFDRMDANRDGALTRDEFARASAGRQQRVGQGGGRQRHGGMGMGGLRGRMFEMADSNRDSRVSMPEAMAAAYRHFDLADANRDGQVTAEERRAVRQRLRAMRRNG